MTVTVSQLFADEAEHLILQRMLDRVPEDIDKAEGSYIWDALSPTAFELNKQAAFFRFISMQGFATYASGEYLDYMGFDYGLERAKAIAAQVDIVFTGLPGGEIPAGTQYAIEGTQLYYVSDQDATFDANGSATVRFTCLTPGIIGNVPNDVITFPISYVPAVLSATNPAPAIGGVDAESSESMRSKVLFFKRNPEHGGTPTDYVRWALSVTGVQWARSINLARGIGSVDVIIGAPVEQMDELIPQVQAMIELKQPEGVHTRAKAANLLNQNFRLYVEGLDALTAEDVAMKYLNLAGMQESVIRLSHLTAALINAGAADARVVEPLDNLVIPANSMLVPVVYIND